MLFADDFVGVNDLREILQKLCRCGTYVDIVVGGD